MSEPGTSPPHPLIAVHGNGVRALDPATGRILWEYSARLVVARFALAHERVYIVDDRCDLHCLVAATGALVGTVQLDRRENFACALLADGDRLYVATNHCVIAIDARGQILWRQETIGSHTARAGLGLPHAVVQPDFYGT